MTCRADNLKLKEDKAVEIFNNILLETSEKMMAVFKEDFVLSAHNKAMMFVIKISPNAPITSFIGNVYSNETYRKNIMARNSDYFLSGDCIKLVDRNGKQKIVPVFDIIDYWDRMDDPLRKYVLDSLCMMIDVAEIYIGYMSERSMIANELRGKKHAVNVVA